MYCFTQRMLTCLWCNLQCLYFTKLQSRSAREWGRKERWGCTDRLNVGKERQKWRKKCQGILLSRRKEATRIARWEGRNWGYMKAVISADSNSRAALLQFLVSKMMYCYGGRNLSEVLRGLQLRILCPESIALSCSHTNLVFDFCF